jgi:hypothetical protein
VRLTTAARRLFICFSLLATGCAAPQGDWQKVGGPLQDVSGMALVAAEGASERRRVEFLVVHDNKGGDEPQVASVVVGSNRLAYRALPWPELSETAVELEAVCGIPETPGSFLAMTSTGRLLHLRYGGREDGGGASDALEVLHESTLPGVAEQPNLKGFAIQSLGGKSVAIWAESGDGRKPGVLYWGTYDTVADNVKLVGQAQVAVPYPAGMYTRHVTDLRLDTSGVVWGAAASDPGDRGPFESVIYALGTIQARGDAIVFERNVLPTRLWTMKRKVEALELVPGANGRIYFGADDEAGGGWIYTGRP